MNSPSDQKQRLREATDRVRQLGDLASLGADSLDRVELECELAEEFGRDVAEHAIAAVAKEKRAGASGPSPRDSEPLWDRDLDG